VEKNFLEAFFRRQCVGKANRNKGISYNAVRGQALETAMRAGETETICYQAFVKNDEKALNVTFVIR